MKRLVAAAVVIAGAVAAELLLPGAPVYHSGWYNVALAALAIVVIADGRKAFKNALRPRTRLAVAAVTFGAVASGIAGIANGLFAPDDRDVVGAPGERVRVEALGTLAFPLVTPGSATPGVELERPLRTALAIGARRRYAGTFALRTTPRDVVYVEARDLRGDRLTITQPEGTVFLSPVLLMQNRQTIAGMDVPFDSFNVPAARRVVKAILFSPAQAAVLARDAIPGQGAVLFAVDDENDRPLPRGIALSAGGGTVRAANLQLRAAIASYPQVEVVSTPNLTVVAIGTLLVIGGLAALV